jgi:uncharacterized protein (TIGR02147 family)
MQQRTQGHTPGTSQGYREQLQRELERRKRTNPHFSLRSFARTLDLSPSFLSHVINGHKNLSLVSALKIAQKLRYSPTEADSFVDLVKLEMQQVVAPQLPEKFNEGLTLQLEAFQVISDWYHFAIRELVMTKGFKPDVKWIAKRLKIKPTEAKDAIDRLLLLGLLERKPDGGLVNTENYIKTPTNQPSRAIRNHHQQMIQKAQEALENQPVTHRDIVGTTLTIRRDQIDLAKREIAKFHRHLAKLLNSPEASEVYQFNTQFFALTEPEEVSHET